MEGRVGVRQQGRTTKGGPVDTQSYERGVERENAGGRMALGGDEREVMAWKTSQQINQARKNTKTKKDTTHI